MKEAINHQKSPLIWKISIFTLLGLVTIALYFAVDRYHATGEQLLQNNDFSQGLQDWAQSKSATPRSGVNEGVLELHIVEEGSSAQVSQKIKISSLGKRVILQATLSSSNIIKGPKNWNRGRVILVQYSDGKPQYQIAHQLVSLEGTNDSKEYTVTLPIIPWDSDAKLIVQMSRCVGALYCEELGLFRAEKNPLYSIVKWSVLGSWALFALLLFCSRLFDTKLGILRPALVLLTIGGIIVGATLPGELKNKLKSEIIKETKAYTTTVSAPVDHTITNIAIKLKIDRPTIDITKVAHFVIFGLLAFLLMSQSPLSSFGGIIIDIFMLACGTELAQLFIEGRGALFTDVVIDMAGCGVGILLMIVIRSKKKRNIEYVRVG